jgi:hypothetical protein
LLIFVDDTGHETFAGNQDWYGLGGCVVLGAHYDWLKARWREVRKHLTGSPDTLLHASDTSIRSTENYEVLRDFFSIRSFARIAVTSTARARLPDNMHSAVPVFGKLQEHIAEAVRCIPCDEVVLIVEASQRADPIVVRHFGQLKPAVKTNVPVRHRFLPKASGEPGLEIADFIISAAKSQTTRHIKSKTGFAFDFVDVFRQIPLADRWFR